MRYPRNGFSYVAGESVRRGVGDALALAVDVGATAGVIGVGCELVVGAHADSTKAKNASTRMPVRMLRLSASPVPLSSNLCTESRVRRLRSFSSRLPPLVLSAISGCGLMCVSLLLTLTSLSLF